MPETMTMSFGETPALVAPILTPFRTPKSPQPGHQSGSTMPSKRSTGSSTMVAIVPPESPNFFLCLIDRLPGIGRAGLNTDAQLAGFRAGFPINDFHIPNGLAVAVALGFSNVAGTNLVTQIHAHVMVGNLAGLGLADVERMRLALENSPDLSRDGSGLERLAIVFQDLVADGVARLSAQKTCELARGVHFHADGALATFENVDRFFLMERKQILEVKLIGTYSRGIQLLDSFANHPSGRTPAD